MTVSWDGLVIDVSIKSSCFDGKAFGWLVDWLVGCLQRRGHHVTNLYNPRPIESIILYEENHLRAYILFLQYHCVYVCVYPYHTLLLQSDQRYCRIISVRVMNYYLTIFN